MFLIFMAKDEVNYAIPIENILYIKKFDDCKLYHIFIKGLKDEIFITNYISFSTNILNF